MYEIPDEIVAAAQRADYEWSRTRKADGRGWGSVPDNQVRRLIAGAVAAEQDRRIMAVLWASRDQDCPRPFALRRLSDVTGVSGTGTVAYGVQFADGQVVVRWLGEYASTVVWESLDDAMHVHSHDGKTRVVWLSENLSDLADVERRMEEAEAKVADLTKDQS